MHFFSSGINSRVQICLPFECGVSKDRVSWLRRFEQAAARRVMHEVNTPSETVGLKRHSRFRLKYLYIAK